MKKRKRTSKVKIISFLIFVLFCFSLTVVDSCADEEKSDYSLIIDDAEKLIDDFNSSLPDGVDRFEDIADVSDSVGFKFIINNLIGVLNGAKGEFLSFFLLLFGLSLFMAISANLDGEIGTVCKNSVTLVCAFVVFGKMFSLVGIVCESLEEINVFFSAMIPLVASVNLLGLSPSTASVQAFGMNMTLHIYSTIGGGFLSSLVGALFTVSAVSAFDNSFFGGVARGIKNAFFAFMGILTTLIGATFSLQNIISSYADSGVVRTAKYALAGMIPIVGNTVSGAFTTLAGGVSYVKGIIGGGAIAVIITIMIAPLVTLLMYRLCFNIAIFFANAASAEQGAGMLASFLSALDTLIAVYALTAVIYIVQLSVFLKGGASLV